MKVVVRNQLSYYLNRKILNNSLWYPYHHISSQLKVAKVLVNFRQLINTSTTCIFFIIYLIYLSVLSQLLYWISQLCNWITTLLTTILRIILFEVPFSPKRSTSPQHQTTFSIVLPSIIKVWWYSDCLLEHWVVPQIQLNQLCSLYTTFVVYLTTTGRQFNLWERNYFRRCRFTDITNLIFLNYHLLFSRVFTLWAL